MSTIKVDTITDEAGTGSPNFSQGATVSGNLSVDGGTIKLDGNYPVGTGNVALGDTALDSLSTGARNTAIGSSALTANNTNDNTALGFSALSASTSDANVAIGTYALNSNTTGNSNVSVGRSALLSDTTGSNNTGLGRDALRSNTTANNNTAVGYQSLYSNTTGSVNVAIGFSAGKSNTTGSSSVIVGDEAGFTNTTSVSNVYVGRQSGYYATGGENTFVGNSAGVFVSSGQKNTILGRYSGDQGGLDIRTSSNNIVLSRMRVQSNGDTFIGKTSGVTGAYLQLGGSSSHASLRMENNYGSGNDLVCLINNGSNGTYQPFVFENGGTNRGSIQTTTSGTSYFTSSDYRMKENVVDLTGATARLNQLAPKRFNFIGDDSNPTVDGFLAHEAQTVVPEAVSGAHNEVDADGNPVYQQIDQSKLVPLLVATIQELEARITALENA